jgi:hypothetical protein
MCSHPHVPEDLPVPPRDDLIPCKVPGCKGHTTGFGTFAPIMSVSVDEELNQPRDPRSWDYPVDGPSRYEVSEIPAKKPSEMTAQEISAYVADRRERFARFRGKLTHLLNEMGMEQDSDTPDFLISEYLIRCLKAYNFAHAYRRDNES